MASFDDDANVDKDLLSQIFADEGDAETDALLGELLKEAEEAEPKNDSLESDSGITETDTLSEIAEYEQNEETPIIETPVTEVQEESIAEVSAEEAPIAQEAAAVPEETPVAEVPQEAITETPSSVSSPVTQPANDNDIVLNEAMEKINADRLQGNTTTITNGTEINGSISSNGSLEVCGVIQGDIDCRGMVCVIGQVTGDIIASEIYVSTSKRMSGDLSSEGAIKVGEGTKIMGNVNATSAYIAGAIKGNIDVNGHVEVDSTAIIRGDINAKSIQVNSGAVVDGKMSLNYAGVDLDSFFED